MTMKFKDTATHGSANGFPCRICGKTAISFHYGACDECTREALALLTSTREKACGK